MDTKANPRLELTPRVGREASAPDTREVLVARHGEAWFGFPQANASEMRLLTPWGPVDLTQEKACVEEMSLKSVATSLLFSQCSCINLKGTVVLISKAHSYPVASATAWPPGWLSASTGC